MSLEETLIKTIGDGSQDNLLMKAMLYLILYHLKDKEEEPEEEIKSEYSLSDALESVYKKRTIGMIPQPS